MKAWCIGALLRVGMRGLEGIELRFSGIRVEFEGEVKIEHSGLIKF